MAHGEAREGKWRGNWWMQCVASTLHTTSEHGVSSITTADAHTSAAISRLNWRPPADLNGLVPFARKTKSGFCACTITFQLASIAVLLNKKTVMHRGTLTRRHQPLVTNRTWWWFKTVLPQTLRYRLSVKQLMYSNIAHQTVSDDVTYVHLPTPWCRVLLEKLTGLQLVKKFPAFHGNRRFITALKQASRTWVLLNKVFFFYKEELLAPRATPKLEDHSSSAVRDRIFNLLASSLLIGGRSSIRNLRTRQAVVTQRYMSTASLNNQWKLVGNSMCSTLQYH